MKTFFKIFFIILLMCVIGAAITIFVLTLTGNGGQEKSLKLLEKVYTKREQYLDGMYCEIDYSSSIKKFGDESKTKQNAKYYFGFDGDLRKLVTVFYDADGNFAYMTYKEYEIESETHVVVKDYGVYEFKKGFGGNVIEYVGEFDLEITNFNKIYKYLTAPIPFHSQKRAALTDSS